MSHSHCAKMGCKIKCFCLLFLLFLSTSESSSHWIVTEKGKIRPQDVSPYSLQQSHNLMAFIKQEQRVLQLHLLRQKLVHYKNQFIELIEMNRLFKQSDIAYPTTLSCKRDDNVITEPSLIPLEDKGISHHDYLDPAPAEPSHQPICSQFTDLPFSMYTMQHLPAVQAKDSLSSTAELLLVIPFYLQLHELGNSIYQGLERNTTSWVLYSLASIYWRAYGDAEQAIDCIQRCIYFAPRKYHDIPLLHLTNVLFTSHRLRDALVPLRVALSFSQSQGPLYYTLALIYQELDYLSDTITALDTALYYKYRHKTTLALRNKLYCQLISQGHPPHSSMDRIIDAKHQLKQFCKVVQEVVMDTTGEPAHSWMDLFIDTAVHTGQTHSDTTWSRSYSKPPDASNIETLLVCVIDDIVTLEEGQCNTTLLRVEKQLQYIKARQTNRPQIHLVCESCQIPVTNKNCPHVLTLFYPRPTCPRNTPSSSSKNLPTLTQSKSRKPSRYTEAYRSMEFLPYSALPPSLEDIIFHDKTPSVDYNDPHWPNKGQCLELVEGLNDNLPRFTGTFLTPEAHGVKELLTKGSLSWQLEPYCANVTSLPHSMVTLDHLMGVANREYLTTGDTVAEAALKQLFTTTIGDATDSQCTMKEAAQYITAALYKYSYHWGVYNLASVYWRAIGNGLQSVECLRRGIHFAPQTSRDIGLIGLANVLHRHGYLDSAMVTARAALDIQTNSPIGHYTVAGVYLTRGDLMATNLHLRMSLYLQPHFTHAYSALKLVRCSLKFKEEQKLLEQKQQLLLAQQELIKSGREPTSENLQEILKQILKQRKQGQTKNLSEHEAVKYLTHLALTLRRGVVTESIPAQVTFPTSPSQVTASSSSFSSSSHSGSSKKPLSTRTQRPKYTMELMAKENEREAALRKKWPENLPWPSLDDCRHNPPPQYVVFTSTWLSVTAKKINITDYMDFNQSIKEYSLLPFCELNFEPSSITLDYLEGMKKPPLLDYIAERGLEEVLCKLSGSYHSMNELATRMKLAMMKNDSNWVVSNLAALYWRIVGDGVQSLKCLKHALFHAPPHNRDVAYVSLANVLYRSGYYEDAATSMQLALETSPNLIVNHFTMANILAAQSFYREAAGYYELVLYHQPEFGPAAERLRASRCMIILGENKIKLKELHEKTTD